MSISKIMNLYSLPDQNELAKVMHIGPLPYQLEPNKYITFFICSILRSYLTYLGYKGHSQPYTVQKKMLLEQT